jgi:hypothetical protein
VRTTRTTLTLDEDVAARLKAQARRTGQPFKEGVNDTLRRGLAAERALQGRAPFRVEARDLGRLRPGVSLDNVAELLEQIEGPLHR